MVQYLAANSLIFDANTKRLSRQQKFNTWIAWWRLCTQSPGVQITRKSSLLQTTCGQERRKEKIESAYDPIR
jgi:hypothetical protein